MDSLTKIVKFAQRNKHVQESLEIIRESLRIYKIENTCISFNGGKDCTALLHLVHSLASNENGYSINAFYAQLPDYFEEESVFVDETVKRYNLQLLKYSTGSLKESLYRLKADVPNIEAVFVGTRHGDLKPGLKMEIYAPTDDKWPKFMRINPLLNWSYDQVWDFIRQLGVPYCDLYNQGYSSLGTKNDTTKNSSLIEYDENGHPRYLPAWQLSKSSEERLSRSSSLDVGRNV